MLFVTWYRVVCSFITTSLYLYCWEQTHKETLHIILATALRPCLKSCAFNSWRPLSKKMYSHQRHLNQMFLNADDIWERGSDVQMLWRMSLRWRSVDDRWLFLQPEQKLLKGTAHHTSIIDCFAYCYFTMQNGVYSELLVLYQTLGCACTSRTLCDPSKYRSKSRSSTQLTQVWCGNFSNKQITSFVVWLNF